MFHPYDEPTGPFPVAQWAVFVLPGSLLQMNQWITQNREGYSVFMHPNTGCMVEDHSDWGIWNGDPYPLDLTFFDKDRPFPW